LFGIPIPFSDLIKDPSKFFSDIVQGIVKEIVEAPIVWMLETLIKNLSYQHTMFLEGRLLDCSLLAATCLVTIFFMIRILNGMKENITGENNANFAEIMGSYLISFVLIKATPYIVTNFLMMISEKLLADIPYFTLGRSLNDVDPSKGIHGLIDYADYTEYGTWFWVIVLIILFIALIAFTLSAAILNVELGILILLGPLIATTFQNRSQVFRMYWTECVAVVFTRNLQLFLFLAMLGFLVKGPSNLLYAFGVAVVAIRGPQVLRQYLQGGSVPGGGVASGVGRLVVYRTMFKAIGK
jgi:hypothetical protein